MNNKRSGKPFTKKGAPMKKSESRDSDKNAFKGKKKFDSRGSSTTKKFQDKKFKKEEGPSDFSQKSSSPRSRNKSENFRDKKSSATSGKRKFSDKDKKFSGKNFNKPASKEKPGFAKDKSRPSDRKKVDFAGKDNPQKFTKQPIYDIKPPKGGKKKEEPADGKIRLNKYIANSGVCSRRDADELISLGEVTVNGNIVTELGFKVTKDDVVTLHGRRLKPEKLVYVLLNKPKDFITTTDDPQERKTVMALVQNACKERIFPVGRLDRNTTGLLLFTNDGDLAEKLTHPSKKIKKIYQADLDKPITRDDFEKILNGLRLEDGPIKPDALEIVSPDKKSIGIEIHEGRNRIVRRIFEHLGYTVVRLDRVMYGGLTKKDLPRGHWRYLSEKEVIRLKYF